MKYGPELTPAMQRKLEAEIKAFNKAATQKLIEENAVGQADVNAHQDWVETAGFQPVASDPDLLAESDVVKWASAEGSDQVKDAQADIKFILSPMQYKVWRLCMRDALTQQDAAKTLGIKQQAVSAYLETAIEKVKKHFEGAK